MGTGSGPGTGCGSSDDGCLEAKPGAEASHQTLVERGVEERAEILGIGSGDFLQCSLTLGLSGEVDQKILGEKASPFFHPAGSFCHDLGFVVGPKCKEVYQDTENEGKKAFNPRNQSRSIAYSNQTRQD
ncbi:hypothetical protein CRENBAI_007398 [Crenichthys baileyi]|uniref:Uncharacterized protein n=1 Tax=Crenichthys baileyi TaxID=28760 RepID=A0AAV9S1A9_9TELE